MPDEWRTLTAILRKPDYEFLCAVVQRIADRERVQFGTALLLLVQDWLLDPANGAYDPATDERA